MKRNAEIRTAAIILFFSALAVFVKLPYALSPQLSGLNLGGDDSAMLHALRRVERGLEYTIPNWEKTAERKDLSFVGRQFIGQQPPGARWAVSAAAKTGAGLHASYSIVYLAMVFFGVAGWMRFGKIFLSPGSLLLFGVGLVLYYSGLKGKLAYAFMWAILPYYFMLLVSAMDCEKNSSPAHSAAIAALVAASVFVWFGGFYLGVAGGASILFLGKGPFVRRAGRAAVIASSGFLALIAIGKLIQTEAVSQYSSKLVLGFNLFHIPFSHYFSAISIFFGDMPAAATASFSLSALRSNASAAVIMILALFSVAVLAISASAFIRGLLSGKQKKFLYIFLFHFSVLFAFLFAISVIFLDPRVQGNANALMQAETYMWHLATAGALFWIASVWAWIAESIKGELGNLSRYAAIGFLCFAAAIVSANLIISATGIGKNWKSAALKRQESRLASDFIRNDSMEKNYGRAIVFDAEKKHHLIDGRFDVLNQFHNCEWLKESKNTQPVFIYVVSRRNLRPSAFRKTSGEVLFRDSLEMVSALKLEKMAQFLGGDVIIFGGEVMPYSKGSIECGL
ncbi:MAG TPA: hypothetical protein PLK80_13085 [bacterium]|nr:MAG: hypothetical protein BWY28_00280 [bacterium ADurb.Bin236]HOY62298.1 hypothetical protein [bacterium]HPI77660.1 hypothetical protein [bacterium]HPN93912.1 hypothetical protein [bacterium]